MNLICIGAQKAGTTSLHKILSQHPKIAKSKRKELHYFDRENYNGFNEEEYNNFFSDDVSKLKVDITPSYLFVEETAKRIYEAFGSNAKIVVLLRNPIKRAVSQYLMSVRKGHENLPFEDTFALEESRIIKDREGYITHSYYQRGLYYKQLMRYYSLFPKENILIVKFEDFVKDQQNEVNKILDFAGLDRIIIRSDIQANKGNEPRFKSINRMQYRLVRGLKKTPLRKLHFLRKVNNLFLRLNKSKKMHKVELSNEYRNQLLAFFKDDMSKLSTLVDFEITDWY